MDFDPEEYCKVCGAKNKVHIPEGPCPSGATMRRPFWALHNKELDCWVVIFGPKNRIICRCYTDKLHGTVGKNDARWIAKEMNEGWEKK